MTNLLVRGHSCVSSYIVPSENPCCVSDRPREHRRVCVVTSKDRILSLRTARYSLASPQDDILLPHCPAATEDLLLCLHVDKSVHTQVTHPFGCCRNNTGHVHLLRAGHHRRVDGSRRCLLPRGSTRSAEGLRHPCSRIQTEVEAQLRRFSTVLDAVNHVLEIRRTSCTKAYSESVSDCVVPSRFDRECQDL